MDRFYDFFLSLGPEGQFGIFMVSICTVYMALGLLSGLLDWLFRKPVVQEKQVVLAWNIVVIDPGRTYQQILVVPTSISAESLSCVVNGHVIEGPFNDLDKAIARKDELKKKL